MGKYVTVEFAVVDSKSGRGEYDSKQTLKKIVNQALKDYNWRLMSDGVNYRMGFLSGRLKGVECESDLVKDVESRINTNP